jgi:hypothetical protein
MAMFFRQYAYESDFRSPNDKSRYAYLSYYSNHRRRWPTSPVGFAQKAILDADGCVAIHPHRCSVPANLFSSGSSSYDGDGTLLTADGRIPASVGLLHHYRRCCNLDSDPRFGPDYCRSQPLLYDDTVAKKYEDRLNRRLAVEFAKFGLTAISSDTTRRSDDRRPCM